MGKKIFGKARFSSVGMVVAGTAKPEFEKEVLSLFDKVISSKDAVYHDTRTEDLMFLILD